MMIEKKVNNQRSAHRCAALHLSFGIIAGFMVAPPLGAAQAQQAPINPHTGRPVVQLPNGDGPNGTVDSRSIHTATGLASCSNVVNPERSVSPDLAERCLVNANAAIGNGQIADVPAMALALRQIPFTNAAGNDYVAQMSSTLAAAIAEPVRTYNAAVQQFLANPNSVQPTPVYRTNYSNPASTAVNPFAQPPEPFRIQRDPINHSPYTPREISSITATVIDPLPSAAQLPNREIPIDTGMTYLATAADAVINPSRYTAPGMTIAQTVATARAGSNTRAAVSAELDREIAVACFEGDRTRLSNGGVADLGTCRLSAARNTLEMMANGQAASYNSARYGVPARAIRR